MELVALYLPDLAFPAIEGNLIFKYNVKNKRFEMEIDKEFSYSFEDIVDDDLWIFFKIDKLDDSNKKVSQVSSDEIKKLILLCSLMDLKRQA